MSDQRAQDVRTAASQFFHVLRCFIAERSPADEYDAAEYASFDVPSWEKLLAELHATWLEKGSKEEPHS